MLNEFFRAGTYCFVMLLLWKLFQATTRDAFGWEVSVVASLKLPGMLQQEDGTFPFIVVRDGRMLRFGPYDMEKQKIDMVNTKTMRESAATARSIAAVALGTASSGGVKPKHISLDI